ncbi:MAG: hypothetical protein KJZ95_16390 [Caldilinea sp.]|nr:hypothetical protein [Caldilinea sp.]
MSVLGWVMYALAVMLLIVSILLGLSVSGASAAIPAATIGFQSPVLKPIWDALVSGLQFLGVLVFGSGLILATLIFSMGLLMRRIADLEYRISQLAGTVEAAPEQTSDAHHQPSLASGERIEHAP